MDQEPLSAILGLDIGRINTRASLFTVSQGKYRLLECGMAPTSLGPGLHLGIGAGEAMQVLQENSGHVILNAEGGLVMPAAAVGLGVDRMALTTSAGPRIKTVLIGLSEQGSLRAGRALADSMMLELAGVFGSAVLLDESSIVDELIKILPDMILIAGGEDGGAEGPVRRWVEVLRWLYTLLPEQVKPTLLYSGNPKLEGVVRRRLEPLTSLQISPNIQPVVGEWDLVPAQNFIEREIVRTWEERVTGFSDMTRLTQTLGGTNGFMLGRAVRHLIRTVESSRPAAEDRGILLVDLGGGSTTISAGMRGRTGTVTMDAWAGAASREVDALCQATHRWSVTPVTEQEAREYIIEHALYAAAVPDNLKELSLSQAAARYRLECAVKRFSEDHHWFDLNSEDVGHFEPVIASGAVLTQAPTPGQAMLILLDGLQPCDITTLVLDRYHLLPLLSAAGEAQPVLPVHVLASDAFMNLGTVISPISQASNGKQILNVQVSAEDGTEYSVDITQGTLRRLVIPAGVKAVLELKPSRQTRIGFGGKGIGGRLKVTSGALGVVIDARGRPLRLPDDDESRVEKLQHWHWSLSG